MEQVVTVGGAGDTAITRVNEMGAEILRLKQATAELTQQLEQTNWILSQTQAALELANGRIAILEACINANYEASMVSK
jgi:hypothetical protein